MKVGDKYIGYRFRDTSTYGKVITITSIEKPDLVTHIVNFTYDDTGEKHWASVTAFPRYFQPLGKKK